MKVIGFRCSTEIITYSILTGMKSKPKVQKTITIKIPKGYKRIDELKWIFQEISDLIRSELPELICLKETEPSARKGKNYTKRIENESIIIIASSLLCIKNYFKKIKSTIAKDFGLKGKSKYLETQMDYSPIDNFSSYNEHEKESIISAWSILK